ncbi:hypothetical protein K435DRAFT_874972 [Dendrothele bispora CBS 962.96]|uniref:Bacteriophage T5 Orf172 DNA-binding domain-containing protein n=1 Tax=Dendrothele bispora (strain CBS 962.96) TaxID=1314807 RepID=A0A4S8KVM0_DENBC|nr:hypothetical protein K435DRAFT_874972 [Dendrothele bispora CBS 962.96]
MPSFYYLLFCPSVRRILAAPLTRHENSGSIYALRLGYSYTFKIGQTKRPFCTRFAEHCRRCPSNGYSAERNLKCRYAKKTEQLVHALLREMGMQRTPTPCNDCGTCHREFFHLPPGFDDDCIDDLLVFAKSVVEYLY